MKKASKIAALVAGGLFVSAAQASVIYNFNADPGSATQPYAQVTGGQLEVTDAAYRAGSLHAEYNRPPIIGDPFTSPILHLVFDVDHGGLEVRPRGEILYATHTPFLASLVFNANGTLSGNMDINDYEDEAKATGSSNGWHVFDYGSDYFPEPPCSGDQLCDIGTGNWLLDASTVPNDVPEPSAWALFGLAILGMMGVAKRRA